MGDSMLVLRRVMGGVLVCGLLALAAPVLAGPASASSTPGAGYERVGAGTMGFGATSNKGLIHVSVDGTTSENLLADPTAVVSRVRLAPDGASVLYKYLDGGLTRTALDGTVNDSLFDPTAGGVTWTPDGQQVLLTQPNANNVYADLWRAPATGGPGVLAGKNLAMATLFPDGQTVLALPAGSFAAKLVDLASGTVKADTNVDTFGDRIGIAPNGRWMAYVAPDGAGGQNLVIQGLGPDGGSLGAEVSHTSLNGFGVDGSFYSASWAPDSSAVEVWGGFGNVAAPVDASGVVGPAVRDTIAGVSTAGPFLWYAPTALITGVPTTVVPGTSVTATIVRSAVPVSSTTTCQLDGGLWSPCGTTWPLGQLAAGPHRLSVRTTATGGLFADSTVYLTVSAPPTCVAGQYGDVATATCVAAPSGTFVPTAGATSPTPCPVGTYSAMAGATSCTLAPAGSYVAVTGSKHATPCAAGSYIPVSGRSSCLVAPIGRYVPKRGARTSLPCAMGLVALTAGRAACLGAPARMRVTRPVIVRHGTRLTASWQPPAARGVVRYQLLVDGRVVASTKARSVVERVSNKKHRLIVLAWYSSGSAAYFARA